MDTLLLSGSRYLVICRIEATPEANYAGWYACFKQCVNHRKHCKDSIEVVWERSQSVAKELPRGNKLRVHKCNALKTLLIWKHWCEYAVILFMTCQRCGSDCVRWLAFKQIATSSRLNAAHTNDGFVFVMLAVTNKFCFTTIFFEDFANLRLLMESYVPLCISQVYILSLWCVSYLLPHPTFQRHV